MAEKLDEKWSESWEKNFDSSLKAINKFKDDLKAKPTELPVVLKKKYQLYLELLSAEVEDIKYRFSL